MRSPLHAAQIGEIHVYFLCTSVDIVFSSTCRFHQRHATVASLFLLRRCSVLTNSLMPTGISLISPSTSCLSSAGVPLPGPSLSPGTPPRNRILPAWSRSPRCFIFACRLACTQLSRSSLYPSQTQLTHPLMQQLSGSCGRGGIHSPAMYSPRPAARAASTSPRRRAGPARIGPNTMSARLEEAASTDGGAEVCIELVE